MARSVRRDGTLVFYSLHGRDSMCDSDELLKNAVGGMNMQAEVLIMTLLILAYCT